MIGVLKIIRYWFMLMTFPSYAFCWATYKCLVGLINTFVRSLPLKMKFFNRVILRQDRFFACMSLVLLSFYLGIFTHAFDWVVELMRGQVTFATFLMITDFIGVWFAWFIRFSIVFVLLDEWFLRKLLMAKKEKPKADIREEFRLEARERDMIFAGTRFDTGEVLFISNEMRAAHVNNIGTPGTGKTESFILPWVVQDIFRGYGSLIVDAKGSMDFFRKLYSYHFQKNPLEDKRQKIFLINLGNPKLSNSYNPLFRGSAMDLKDRIMGAFEWKEPYYKTKSESVLMRLLQGIEAAGKKVTFEDLYTLLTESLAVEKLITMIPQTKKNQSIIRQLQTKVLGDFKSVQDTSNGLANNIYLMYQGGLDEIVNTYNPDVDLLECYKQNQIVFFSLPTNLRGETARAFGKMLLMDLKSTAGYIELGQAKRHFYPVFIDEFSEFANSEFIGWLNKSRSSGMCAHVSYQSMGDLERVDPGFAVQMGDNTNLNVIFRVNNSDTAETICKNLGTDSVEKETTVVDKSLLTVSEGNKGSVRPSEEFKIHPNVLKNALRRGQAMIAGKHPDFFYGLFNTDYLPDPEKFEEIQIFRDDVEKASPEEWLNIISIFDENQVPDLSSLAEVGPAAEELPGGEQVFVFEEDENLESMIASVGVESPETVIAGDEDDPFHGLGNEIA